MFSADDSPLPLSVARILAVAARGPPNELALPVEDAFVVHDALSILVLPAVTTLHLATNDYSPHVLRPDLYIPVRRRRLLKNLVFQLTSIRFFPLQETHRTLSTFLPTTFPALTTLHLKGWFDTTGVLGLASPSFRALSKTFSTLAGLLLTLRWIQTVQVHLTNATGHAEGDEAECCISREDPGAWEWSSRLVKYW